MNEERTHHLHGRIARLRAAWIDPRTRNLVLLGTGHFVVDICQGILPLTLPFLFEKLRLDYTATALLVTIAYATSSIAQPLFGLVRKPWMGKAALVAAAPLACAGLMLTAIVPNYPSLLAAIVMSSLGTAMYHPEAAARVHENAGADVGRSMSMFVLCGSIGFTTGAMIFGPLLSFWGLAGTYALILPGLAMPGVLLCLTRRAGTGTTHGVPSHITGAQIARRMSLPVLVMAMRQWVTVGLISLTPLYYVTYLHNTPATGAAMLFALQLGSNLGIFACGVLGKKLGYKRMVVAGLLAAVPPLFLFPHATGLLAALLLCLGGAALAPSMPGLTVIGQELLPGRQALAASLIMGLGVGVGGVASGVLGLIADHAGLPCTLVLLALMPLVSGLLACALPRPELALRKLAP